MRETECTDTINFTNERELTVSCDAALSSVVVNGEAIADYSRARIVGEAAVTGQYLGFILFDVTS